MFYIDPEHYSYWTNFSLPVVLILVDTDTSKAWWQAVTQETVEKTRTGWKIIVPYIQVLNASAAGGFMKIGDLPEAVKRFSDLTLAHPWMAELEDGNQIFVELEEWVNKSSGRGAMKLIVESDGQEVQAISWPMFFLGSKSFQQAVADFFPWANVGIDDELYDEVEEQRWIEENGFWDSETGTYFYDSTYLNEHMELRREYAGYAETMPYEEDGEISRYRFELTLNSIGRGFLAVASYLYGTPPSVRAATPPPEGPIEGGAGGE